MHSFWTTGVGYIELAGIIPCIRADVFNSMREGEYDAALIHDLYKSLLIGKRYYNDFMEKVREEGDKYHLLLTDANKET